MNEKIEKLLKEWHEIAKVDYYNRFKDSVLNYDNIYPHIAKEKQKYINLDEEGSGCYMLEKETGNIFRIKGYGVPNKKKLIGNIETITAQELFDNRWR